MATNNSKNKSVNPKSTDTIVSPEEAYNQIVNVMMGNSKDTSFMSTIEDKMIHLKDSIESSAPIQHTLKDSYGGINGYGNTVTYSGADDKVASFTNYGFNNDTMNYPLWTVLYNDSWVFRRAIDKPANDMINSGIILKSDNDITDVYEMYNKYKPDLILLSKWGALYGGAVAFMMFDNLDDSEYAEPLNIDKIRGNPMRLYVTDRWYGVSVCGNETVTDMSDVDFGKPVYYNITYANGTSIKVHHSYIIRYEHRNAPSIVKNGMLQGWGYSEGSHILNELARDDQLKASIQNLVNKALIEVVKMPGMRGVFMGADQGQMSQLTKRLEMVNWARTYNSLTFLDKEDEYQQNSFQGLTGLSDILEKNLWMIGAALEMQGVIYGDLKGGLSQNSDAMVRYDGTIHNRCEEFLRHPIAKLLNVIYGMCGIEDSVNFDFGHIAKDEINKLKNSSITSFASTLQQIVKNKWISDYRAVLSLKSFVESGDLHISFSDEYLKVLELQEKKDIASSISKPDKKNSTPGGDAGGGLGALGGADDALGDLGGADDDMPMGDIGGAPMGADLGGDNLEAVSGDEGSATEAPLDATME